MLTSDAIDKIGIITVGSFAVDAVARIIRADWSHPLANLTPMEALLQISLKLAENAAGIIGAVGVIIIYYWLHIYRMKIEANRQAVRIAKKIEECCKPGDDEDVSEGSIEQATVDLK